ncbi:MAG: MFS transporter [Planctomycetota bacterium]|jgi:MFS family permease
MNEDDKTSGLFGDRAWPLYGAAFATALSLSICWTAMPFVLSGMGGSEAHVGYAPAANSLAYMAALFMTGSLLGHLDVRRATRAAIGLAFLGAVMMVLAVWAGGRSSSVSHLVWVWSIIASGGVGGAAMAFYWPFLMSWVSARYEGVELNRRFGRYNGSWSGGAVAGPLIGAWLVEIHPLWPMAAAAICHVLSFLMLCLARNGTGHVTETSAEAVPDAPCDARMLADYRWMSRVSLFCAWASYSIVRSQFALRFVGLGYSEPQFGLYVTTFALCNFLALIAAGRWAFWHFKATYLLGAQLMFLAAALMIVYGRTLGVFYGSSVILGLAFGFAYSSHLYYGASTSRKRSVRMTIHELVISVGIAVGAGTGGYLAKHVAWDAPYWFAVGLIGLGGLIQVAIHLASRALVRRQSRTAGR